MEVLARALPHFASTVHCAATLRASFDTRTVSGAWMPSKSVKPIVSAKKARAAGFAGAPVRAPPLAP